MYKSSRALALLLVLRAMKKIILAAAMGATVLGGCKVLSVNYKTVPAEIPFSDSLSTVVVVDAAEVRTPGLVLTKKREEVVTRIKEDYVRHLPSDIRLALGNPALVDTSLSEGEKLKLLNDDKNVIESVFNKHHAAMILVLKDCAGGFTQDEVMKETQTDGSSSKKAYYSVFFQADYHIIQKGSSWNKSILAQQKHSSRSVLSGLLARGPGYEANRKDIAKMADLNAQQTTALFREQKVAVNGWQK